MKKWILIILSIIILIGGIGYVKFQRVYPELTVKVILDKVQEDNYALILNSEKLELTIEQRDLVEGILSTVSYEIMGSKIEGKNAYVTIDLTFVDLEQLIVNERLTILKQVIANLFGTVEDILNGRVEERVIQTILSLLNDESIEKPMMSKRVELPLMKQKGLWIPNITEEWLDETFDIPDSEDILNKLDIKKATE